MKYLEIKELEALRNRKQLDKKQQARLVILENKLATLAKNAWDLWPKI